MSLSDFTFSPQFPPALRRLLAFGTGVGIEIDGDDLSVTVTRVRPGGVKILASAYIPQFRSRPAAEWGREYAGFLKKAGMSHLAATVLLPRWEVVVRQLAMPGVAGGDLEAAIRFQIDSLHPYGDDEITFSWARLAGTPAVLIGISRRSVIEHYHTLFVEAGIAVASITFTAAVLYSAARVLPAARSGGFLAMRETGEGAEVYGESPSRPVFSAAFDMPPFRVLALAASELRLPVETEPITFVHLLPVPRITPPDYEISRNAMAYATALTGACPRLSLPANLLPPEQRQASSRLIFVPSVVLAVLLVAVLIAWVVYGPIANRRYLAVLEEEIARVEPQAKKVAVLDRNTQQLRARAQMLDNFRRRSRQDMDAINELTRIVALPGYLNMLDLTRDAVTMQGETDQAAGLLKVVDTSDFFQSSEFTIPIVRIGQNEAFRIRAVREGAR